MKSNNSVKDNKGKKPDSAHGNNLAYVNNVLGDKKKEESLKEAVKKVKSERQPNWEKIIKDMLILDDEDIEEKINYYDELIWNLEKRKAGAELGLDYQGLTKEDETQLESYKSLRNLYEKEKLQRDETRKRYYKSSPSPKTGGGDVVYESENALDKNNQIDYNQNKGSEIENSPNLYERMLSLYNTAPGSHENIIEQALNENKYTGFFKFIEEIGNKLGINNYRNRIIGGITYSDPEKNEKDLDKLQLALDLVGLVPGFGEFADGLNALISLSRGNITDAALSAMSMIPIAGLLSAAGKGIKKGKKAFEAINTAAKIADEVIEIGEAAVKNADEIADIGKTLFKNSDEIIDVGKAAAKNADGVLDVGETVARNADEVAEAVRKNLNIKELLIAGNQIDKGGELTKAGRALEKHGSRPGSIYPRATGNVANKNALGNKILESILKDPNAISVIRHHAMYGDILEIKIPGGMGARFTADGSRFIGFLE